MQESATRGHFARRWPRLDHHAYGPADLQALADWSAGLHADLVVTTLKDLVKVRANRLGDRPLYALEIALEILPEGDSAAGLDAVLSAVLGRVMKDLT